MGNERTCMPNVVQLYWVNVLPIIEIFVNKIIFIFNIYLFAHMLYICRH